MRIFSLGRKNNILIKKKECSEEDEEEAVQATSEGWGCDRCHICGPDFLVEVAVAKARPPSDEYETDSEYGSSDREDDDIAPIAVFRSRRAIRAHFRLDL